MIMVKIKANVHAEDQWCSPHKVHLGPWESCIMYTKCICGRVSLSTLDRPSLNFPWPWLTHNQHSFVNQQSTNFHLIFMGRLTLGQLSTDCESSVDQVLTEIDRDVNWVPIMMLLLRALNEGINQQWIMDAITHHPESLPIMKRKKVG